MKATWNCVLFAACLMSSFIAVVLSADPVPMKCSDTEYECDCKCIPRTQDCPSGKPNKCAPGKYSCEGTGCIDIDQKCKEKCQSDDWVYSEESKKCVPKDSSDYWICKEKYVLKSTPCENNCTEDRVLVVSECHVINQTAWKCGNGYVSNQWPCGDKCQPLDALCGENCPHGHYVCEDNASKKCIKNGILCPESKKCGEGYITCADATGSVCKSDKDVFVCNNKCQPTSESCDGKSCPAGRWGCVNPDCKDKAVECIADEYVCNDKCKDDKLWRCSELCQIKDKPCNGKCPVGYRLEEGRCNGAAAFVASIVLTLFLAAAPSLFSKHSMNIF